MPYTPDATATTEPTDARFASTAALEFRTLKTYIAGLVAGALTVSAGNGNPRQTVLGGPVTTAGAPDLVGATGATTVTTSNISSTLPFVVSAANGFSSVGAVDRIGISLTNLSWTGLSTNGTMYLYVDVAANGVLTPGSTTLAPSYVQTAGSTTSGQYTFRLTKWQGTLGDGTTANVVYRVFVGAVTVAGAVVTAITWYPYQVLRDPANATGTATYLLTHNGPNTLPTFQAPPSAINFFAAGGIGMTALMTKRGSGSIASNSTVAGSNLDYVSFDTGGLLVSGTSASGTWRNISGISVAQDESGTFQRIS